MAGQDGAVAPDALINRDDGRKYWGDLAADEDAMLGGIPSVEGFANISRIDLQGSRTFLARFGIGNKQGRRTVSSALEGGAGVGRITEGLLLGVAEQVDVIEPIAKFTAGLQSKPGVRSVFNIGLEEWTPSDDVKYELIWTQWCVGHLTDEQLVRYLQRCKSALSSPDGLIVVKENLSTTGADVFDDIDSSVTRQDGKFQSIFQKAGLKIVRQEIQRGIPETSSVQLLPIKMYALKPEGS